MIDHYNAFISYKHAPEDNKVAEAIHKGLEHFHIPYKIQKKTGIKRINRIFRDTDELPITSDLNDTIAHALENSDYLIVICSTNTKQSAWVPREIEYFLRNHTKQQIFTVLVNGEPFDVIPEQLLYEDRTMVNSDGQQQLIRMPMEPLSCDYRMPKRKADKIELPRLASGLIGCSYDELMNRRRQYRVKQMVTVFSAALALTVGFSGYMVYSRDTIRKNYLESLRNQSRYLANESLNYLDKEQRITAIQLALEALPKNEKDDRPVTAEATQALSRATLAYVGNNGENVNAAWNYQMPNYISDFRVSDKGDMIAVRDKGSTVCVWNTNTHDVNLYIDNISSTILGMEYLNDRSLVVWTNNQMFCYDAYNGNKIWELTPEEFDAFEDQQNMMMVGDTFYIGMSSNKYQEIDSATGKVVKTIDIPIKDDTSDDMLTISKISPDKKKIAFGGFIGWEEYVYGVLDIESGKLNVSEKSEARVKNLEWVDEQNLMLATYLLDVTGGSMGYGTKEILSEDHTDIICLNPEDLSVRWKADFVYNGITLNSEIVPLGNNETVAYYSGDIAAIYDVKTGEVQHINNLDDSIIDTSDTNADGIPIYITRNGGYAYPSKEVGNNAVYYDKYFTDDLDRIAINNGVYVMQKGGSEVIFYGLHEYDKNWKVLSDEYAFSDYVSNYYMDDQVLSLLSKEDGKSVVTIYNLKGNSKSFRTELSDETVYNYELLGCRNDILYIGHTNDLSFELISIDITNGKITDNAAFSDNYHDQNKLINGKLVYKYFDQDYKKKIGIYDVEKKETKSLDAPTENDPSQIKMKYYDEAEMIMFPAENEYVIDVTDGKSHKIDVPKSWAGTTCISENCSDSCFAISDDKKILIVNKSGKVSATIRCPGLIPLGMAFVKDTDNIIVYYNDGALYWYSKNGEFVKKSEATVIMNYNGDVHFDFESDDSTIFIQLDKLTDVIDKESGIEVANILRCYGYHKPTNSFITQAYDDNKTLKVGYFRRYSAEELVSTARELLQGTELSDELKSMYGIDD